MFVARANHKETVSIYVATVLHGFLNFEKSRLPTETPSHTFTVMDTSEESVFLHVQTLGADIPIGNIYVSDGSGALYAVSLTNVLRGTELVDFEKVNSLEGVFIANKFEESTSHQSSSLIQSTAGQKGKAKKEFTKAELEAQGLQKSKMS